MKNPIRFTGVLVFLSVLILASALYLLLIDRVVASAIRTAGSQSIGAKIELDSASVSLSEQRLELAQLVVANPSEPMSNLLQAETLNMDIDAAALAWNKVVVDEILVSNLQLGTKRLESGAIDGHWADADTWNPMSKLESFGSETIENLPDPTEVIAREELQTPLAITAFEEKLSTTEADLRTQFEQLPTEENIQQYKVKLDEIIESGSGKNKLLSLLGKGKELKELREAIKADIRQIKSFKDNLTKAKTELSSDIKRIKTLPEQDWLRLKQKYSLSGDGINQVVSALLGPQIGQWSQTAWNYYQLVEPYLNKYQPSTNTTPDESSQITERGRQILFPDEHPLPNYLIKKIAIDSPDSTQGIGLSGSINNLTTEPTRWAQPLTLELTGIADFLSGFILNGTLDHRDPQAKNNTINLVLNGVDLLQFIQSRETGDFKISSGMMDLVAEISLVNDIIQANITMSFAQLQLGADNLDDWQAQLLGGVNQLNKFQLTIELSGNVMDPDFNIASADLSELGKQLIETMASDQLRSFEANLKNEILKQTDGPLAGLSNLDALEQIQKQLNLKELSLEKLLKIGG